MIWQRSVVAKEKVRSVKVINFLKESLLYPPVLYVLIIACFYTVSLSKIGNLTKAF